MTRVLKPSRAPRWARIGFVLAMVTAVITGGIVVGGAVDGGVGSSVAASDAQVFVAMSPQRVLDTRPVTGPIGVPSAAPLGPGQTLDLTLRGAGKPLPTEAIAAVLNVTLDDDATHKSFLTIWPQGETRPNASANNAEPGLVAANSMIAKLGTTGGISIFNQQGSTHVVLDLVGYLLPLDQVSGLAGNHFLVGPGAPSGSTGANGDMYLDTTLKDLYGPKTGGSWGSPVVNLGGGGVAVSGTTPTGACSPNGSMHLNSTTGVIVVCVTGSWSSAVNVKSTINGALTYADSGTSAVAVDLDASFRTVATFTAGSAGTYVLDGRATLYNASVLGVAALATDQCAWFDGSNAQLGPLSAQSQTVELLVLSAGSVNLSPTAQAVLANGATANLRCRVTGLVALSLGGFKASAWSYQVHRIA